MDAEVRSNIEVATEKDNSDLDTCYPQAVGEGITEVVRKNE